MTTWAEGDTVTFKKSTWTGSIGNDSYRSLKGESYKVLDILSVPPEMIEYNPDSEEGGVAHHQWLILEIGGERQTFSGWFFEEVKGT